MFDDKSILITGGTGSFGQRAVHRLLTDYRPRRLVVYSRDEHKQFDMAQQFDAPCMRFFIGDVRDRWRLTDAMKDVDFVIHAAALKHVAAAEYNPMEVVKTNIYGTQNVIHAALANGVEGMIALSTDKAANPVNLYGATKLAADKLVVAANNMAGVNPTRFSVVRYGNIVGSRGSVVPLFKQLASTGAPFIPITDERMTRFWITLDQGVQFVLDAFSRMQGAEIFVPKIPSVRITDVAAAVAPGVPIQVTGIRPGEKVHEIMCPLDDSHLTLDFDDHYVMTPGIIINNRTSDYSTNRRGERSVPTPPDFEYHSGRNEWFLSVDEIRASIEA